MTTDSLAGSGTLEEANAYEHVGEHPAGDAPVARVDKIPFFYAHQRFLIGLLTLVIVGVAWQLTTQLNIVNVHFTSSPYRVVLGEYHYFFKGTPGYGNAATGFADVQKTGTEFVFGFLLAVGFGIPIGITIGWYPTAAALCEPFLNILYAMPFVALAPLFVVWFGLGLESKIALAFVVSILPIVITTSAGVRTVENSLLNVARTYRAGEIQIFRTLVFPGTLPSMISGIRLAAGHALLGAVVGELIAATGGVGYTIAEAGATFQTDRLMAGIAVITLTGLIIASILRRIERKFDTWRIL